MYCKAPVAGPERVVEYIGRYTHRVAISNRRILDVTDDDTVTFEWKDYRDTTPDGAAKTEQMQLCAREFIGRFMMHVLPRGFRRIRMYGILAGGNRREKFEDQLRTFHTSLFLYSRFAFHFGGSIFKSYNLEVGAYPSEHINIGAAELQIS